MVRTGIFQLEQLFQCLQPVEQLDFNTAALDTCRELFRQVHSYLLRDSVLQQAEITYLGVGEIKSQELGGQFLNGCTGLLFMLPVDEPINLCFEPTEWEDE